jgi:hypothetical protein
MKLTYFQNNLALPGVSGVGGVTLWGVGRVFKVLHGEAKGKVDEP